jgi:putative acetyltransferase
MSDLQLRPYHNDDREGVVSLVNGVYQEYGDEVNLAGADADLLDIPSFYLAQGGSFVVLAADRIVGSHALLPLDPDRNCCTFRRLYLAASQRGSGCGEQLMEWAIDLARHQGYQRVEFWSDTRFTRGHRFFQRCGFQSDGQNREMDDGLIPYQEYFFWQDL